MIKYFMSKTIIERAIIGIIFFALIFALSYFVLHISTMEDPPLGNTIYIVIGTTFRFTSILGVLVILKYLYDYRKLKERRERKRKKHKLFFLKDLNKEQEKEEEQKQEQKKD